MTAFSLRLTNGANAVSKLHARDRERDLERASSTDEILGDHQRRPRPDLGRLAGRRAARRATSTPTSTRSTPAPRQDRFWERLDRDPDRATCGRRTCARSASWRSSPTAGCAASSPATARRRRSSPRSRHALDPAILTIGFARRFATYKRAGLLFTDIDRLARLLWDADRPVQIIFAGKAHPADRPGQRVIQEIFQRSRSPQAARPRVHPRGLRHAGRPVPRPGRRRLAQQPAPAARGVGHVGHEGRPERRPEHQRPRRLVGRGLRAATTAGRSAAASRTPTRRPRTGPTRRTCTGCSRRSSSRATTSATRPASRPRWVERRCAASMATTLWRFSTTRMLQEYTERLYLPAAGVEVPVAGRRARRSPRPADARGRRGSRWRSRSTTTSRSATSAGSSPRSTSRPTRRWSTRSSAIPASACRSTTPGPLLEWLDRRAARRHRPPAGAGRRAARSRSWAAASTSRSSPRCRSATGSASSRGWPTSSRRCSGAGRAARGWRSASGSRTCRPRSSRPATTGRSSTTRTSGPRRSRRRTCGARTRPRTRATCCGSSAPSRACATGSRSATSTRSSTTCASHATEAGDRVGMMGDDGEKFGAWPTTWEHCWGEGRWVERFFEALEANADWLTTTTPSAWLADHPPIGRVYVPTGSYAEMGEWALPRRREPRVLRRRSTGRRPSGGPRRAGCAARSGATSRSSTARSTTSTSRCCGRPTAVAAMPDGPERDRGARPPLPGPVERLLLARPVRRDLHQPHAAGHLRAPHRRRGPRRDGGRHRSVAAETARPRHGRRRRGPAGRRAARS